MIGNHKAILCYINDTEVDVYYVNILLIILVIITIYYTILWFLPSNTVTSVCNIEIID